MSRESISGPPPPRPSATPPQLRRGVFALPRTILTLLSLLLFPTLSFADYRTYKIESLEITVDTDWPQSGAVGYFPVRFDITNVGEAREIDISASLNHWFDPSRRSGRASRSMFGGVDMGRAEIRQHIRLKRGDRVKFTMPIPVIADSERIELSFHENGRRLTTDRSNYFSFQSRRPLAEAGALVVSSSSSTLGATVGLRPIVVSAGSYRYPAPAVVRGGPSSTSSSLPKMDLALDPARLPTAWLGYTSLAAVILGPTEWKELNPAQQDALLMWTASGGDLIFVDGSLDMLLPAGQSAVGLSTMDSARPYFLGNIHLLTSDDIGSAGLAKTMTQLDSSNATPDWSLPAVRARDWGWIADRGFRLPITGAGYVPTRAYLSILTLFVALIGPINYIYLWRRGRQVLLVLTVPLISAAFITLLAGYGVLSEGFGVRARAVTFTLLDQNSKKAATRASVSLYPGGLMRSEGVRFASDTAIFPFGTDGTGPRDMSLDLSGEQRYASGLLQPRTPSNFEQITFQPARQRLNFERDGNDWNVVNGLGAKIQRLFYREGGSTYALGAELPAGDRAPLKLAPSRKADLVAMGIRDGIRETSVSPLKFQQIIDGQPDGTYLALIDTSPFWDPGVANPSDTQSLHVVLGFAGGQP